MQPILTPLRPFYVLTIDFILVLSTSAPPDDYNTILSVTDKFGEVVTLISD